MGHLFKKACLTTTTPFKRRLCKLMSEVANTAIGRISGKITQLLYQIDVYMLRRDNINFLLALGATLFSG